MHSELCWEFYHSKCRFRWNFQHENCAFAGLWARSRSERAGGSWFTNGGVGSQWFPKAGTAGWKRRIVVLLHWCLWRWTFKSSKSLSLWKSPKCDWRLLQLLLGGGELGTLHSLAPKSGPSFLWGCNNIANSSHSSGTGIWCHMSEAVPKCEEVKEQVEVAKLCFWEAFVPRAWHLAFLENCVRCFWWNTTWGPGSDFQPCFWCSDLFAREASADQANHGAWLVAFEARILQEWSSPALLLRLGVSDDSKFISLAADGWR